MYCTQTEDNLSDSEIDLTVTLTLEWIGYLSVVLEDLYDFFIILKYWLSPFKQQQIMSELHFIKLTPVCNHFLSSGSKIYQFA